jgi:hypothetical protein
MTDFTALFGRSHRRIEKLVGGTEQRSSHQNFHPANSAEQLEAGSRKGGEAA